MWSTVRNIATFRVGVKVILSGEVRADFIEMI